MADPSVGARLLLGDCIEVMARLADSTVDAVVCDPPYAISFMGRGWDSFDSPRGFQEWCREWANEALRVLKPGGHLLAFGGTRAYHRLAVGIEDAGFDIRDQLMWIYASGFPKSLDVSQAIDAKLGADRQDVYEDKEPFAGESTSYGRGLGVGKVASRPVTEAATEWVGWGTALKPSFEPVALARKPLSGTVAETVLEHGTGALNIDGCRISTGDRWEASGKQSVPSVALRADGALNVSVGSTHKAGRWPANILLGHLPECEGSGAQHTVLLCAPGCPVAELNKQSGESSSSSSMPLPRASGDALGRAHGNRDGETVRGHDDEGGAARFFYIAKPRRRERIGGTIRNLHPTVKPIDLMRYLARLVTPPGGVVLDPFLGSGTTGCAAMIEGFGFIGIERDPDSYEIAVTRISDYAFAHQRVRPVQI